MRIVLINTNRIHPPIAPLGLDYVAEVLHTAGYRVEILDLCWEADWKSAITIFLRSRDVDLIGMTLRNTDDCFFFSRQSFLPEFSEMVQWVRRHTSAPIIVGGVGFSVLPEPILELSDADAGVLSHGEFAFLDIAQRIEKGEEWREAPGIVQKKAGKWQRSIPQFHSLDELPTMSRRWIDNRRYFTAGGQAGVETKRGCPQPCIYCADPVAKGKQIALRPPGEVVKEIQHLFEQGIDHIHFCDSEMNIHEPHLLQICREIIDHNLSDKLRWYAYCAPVPFSADTARLMRQAGCVGINFGVDSGDETMLKRLGRNFTPEDILDATRFCKAVGIAVMLDLLLGAPDETDACIQNTIELMQRSEADCIGIALGVRIYPGTALATQIRTPQRQKGLVGGANVYDPLFFLEPAIAESAVQQIDKLIGDDARFFFFAPGRPGVDYNYNSNQKLTDAIAQGKRGAYWDILRKL